MHWASVRRRLDPWREAVALEWEHIKTANAIEVAALRESVCSVEVILPFKRTEKQWSTDRRDPHNYVSTTIKAIVDSLVDKRKRGQLVEERLFIDDTPQYLTVLEPQFSRVDTTVPGFGSVTVDIKALIGDVG